MHLTKRGAMKRLLSLILIACGCAEHKCEVSRAEVSRLEAQMRSIGMYSLQNKARIGRWDEWIDGTIRPLPEVK